MSEKFLKQFMGKNNRGTEKETFLDSIKEGEFLGEGAYGKVYPIETSIGAHKVNFAIKDYSKRGEGAMHFTKKAYENYLSMKDAGLKVFNTVRINADKPQLLLTLGTKGDNVLISKDSNIKWDKVNEITNLKELVREMSQNVLIGSKEKLEIRTDSYFFIIDKNKPNEVDFVIGDYERMNLLEREPLFLFKKNLNSIKTALNILLKLYLDPNSDKNDIYEEIIEKDILEFESRHAREFKENK